MNHFDYAQYLRQGHSNYHHHKENMAFGATGIYLTGVTALMFLAAPFWEMESQYELRTLAFVMTLIISAAWIAFIAWQYSKRNQAATMVRACDTLLMKWYAANTVDIKIKDRELKDYGRGKWPDFLARELKEQADDHSWQRGIIWSERMTYIITITWGVLLLVRILGWLG